MSIEQGMVEEQTGSAVEQLRWIAALVRQHTVCAKRLANCRGGFARGYRPLRNRVKEICNAIDELVALRRETRRNRFAGVKCVCDSVWFLAWEDLAEILPDCWTVTIPESCFVVARDQSKAPFIDAILTFSLETSSRRDCTIACIRRSAMSKYANITETVGNTPVVKINRLAPPDVNLYVKVEAFNPLGSVKDRLALGVIEEAERTGKLKPGQTVVEATSGNTGIGLAMVCAAKGYPLVVTMAESFSVERRKLMRFLGAKVIVTPAAARAVGMVNKTVELAEKHGWYLHPPV